MNAEDKIQGQGSERRLADWNRALGALVDDMEAADLPERLVRALTCLVPFELAAASMNTQPLASAGKWRRQKSTSRRVSAVIQVPPLGVLAKISSTDEPTVEWKRTVIHTPSV